jgi:hypothetical protein
VKTGDKIIAEIRGERFELELDEHVPYEPAAYHYDDGFWAFSPDEKEFFVSRDGTVYDQAETPQGALTAWNVPVGKVAEIS